jgi:hypothetical protein
MMKTWVAAAQRNIGPKYIFSFLLVVSLCPTLLVPIPAMVDYPNHLARMFILSRDGAAHPFYEVTWAAYPNLAMDLIVPRLARLMSVESATRVFYLLSQVLIVTGAVAIELVVKGRFHISGIVAVMFLYSLPFAWGFLNFEFGLGLALWGIAVSLLVQERHWSLRLGVHAVFAVLLFMAHFFALGLYGATVGLHELWRAWAKKASFGETSARLAALGVPPAALLALMVWSGGAVGGEGTNWFAEFKPLWLIHILNGYSFMLSVAGMAALLGLRYVADKGDVLRFEPAGAWLGAGFTALYLAMPSKLFATSFVDLRIIVAAALVLPAFMSVPLHSRRWRLAAASCAVAITLTNVVVVLWVWTSYRADYAAMIGSFRKINKGSLVLVGHSDDAGDPPLGNLLEYPMYHAPTLAVHYADAFVPTLFTTVGKQPVTARPAYRHLEAAYGGTISVVTLKTLAENEMSWQRDFDYLYVVGPRIPNPMPNLLEELDAAPRFVLYKIRK